MPDDIAVILQPYTLEKVHEKEFDRMRYSKGNRDSHMIGILVMLAI